MRERENRYTLIENSARTSTNTPRDIVHRGIPAKQMDGGKIQHSFKKLIIKKENIEHTTRLSTLSLAMLPFSLIRRKYLEQE